jgi:hypothetical protein
MRAPRIILRRFAQLPRLNPVVPFALANLRLFAPTDQPARSRKRRFTLKGILFKKNCDMRKLIPDMVLR